MASGAFSWPSTHSGTIRYKIFGTKWRWPFSQCLFPTRKVSLMIEEHPTGPRNFSISRTNRRWGRGWKYTVHNVQHRLNASIDTGREVVPCQRNVILQFAEPITAIKLLEIRWCLGTVLRYRSCNYLLLIWRYGTRIVSALSWSRGLFLHVNLSAHRPCCSHMRC